MGDSSETIHSGITQERSRRPARGSEQGRSQPEERYVTLSLSPGEISFWKLEGYDENGDAVLTMGRTTRRVTLPAGMTHPPTNDGWHMRVEEITYTRLRWIRDC